jgi:hypothetical protein
MSNLPQLALSVRQPWAWAIIHAGKDIENRSWQAVNHGLRRRGRIAVHASKGLGKEEYESARDFIDAILAARPGNGLRCPSSPICSAAPAARRPGCAARAARLGLEMELVCVNHWPVAIETHTKNHPQARHYCQDIATVRPHIIVPEGYLDLLMASPTCTHHSVARGGKPTSTSSARSLAHHHLADRAARQALIIENVWEFTGWGPVDPAPASRSRRARANISGHGSIRSALGFEPEWRKLNAADYGDATTRSASS